MAFHTIMRHRHSRWKWFTRCFQLLLPFRRRPSPWCCWCICLPAGWGPWRGPGGAWPVGSGKVPPRGAAGRPSREEPNWTRQNGSPPSTRWPERMKENVIIPKFLVELKTVNDLHPITSLTLFFVLPILFAKAKSKEHVLILLTGTISQI